MKSVALQCQRISHLAAEPTYVGEKIKEQKGRSFNRLRLHEFDNGDSILHKSWNGQGGPTHLVLLQGQADKIGLVIPPPFHAIIAEMQSKIEGLRHINAEFHAPQIQFYCDEIERLMRVINRR